MTTDVSGAADQPDADARLRRLEERLGELGERPVAEHADVLDEVHRALVAELDRLAGAGSSRPRS